MINQYLGFVQSSTVASRWWSISNSMRPPTTHHQYHHHFTESSNLDSSSWSTNDNPQSWSQALVGGLMFDDDYAYKQSSRIQMMQENSIPLNQGLIPIEGAKNSKNLWYHESTHSLNDDYSHLSSNVKRPRNESPCPPESKSNGKGGTAKKARVISHSLDQSTFKVRKEKLGDRITALHQLVSPFGKTDTASVLLESIGYIRFLQNQIEALSQPYLNCTKSKNTRQQNTASDEEEPNKDLRSKGLCLVPIECTLHVGAEKMGADYWASAFNAK